MLAVCVDFEIDPQNPSKIFLYELNDDAVAFELQKNASRYPEFNDAISGMVNKNRSVCFKKLTTNLGLNVRRFVLSPLKMFAVSNKLALAGT